MSVVVRMEMPQDCWFCPNGHPDWIYNDDGAEQMACFCNICNTEEDDKWISGIETERPSWCPIIWQLPEGHGRLVDAEILRAKLIEHIAETNGFYNAFNETPTIVPAEARNTEKGALKIWNNRTSEISHKLWKLKHRWIVKGDLLVCPKCNVAQKKPKETEPTPFCPICGAWLTDETTQEWILKNTVSSKVDTEEKIET